MLEDLRKLIKAGKDAATQGSAELRKFVKDNSKGVPKTLEQCQAKVLKLKQQIEQEEVKKQHKEDNKNVALGTSKINYMDPRITIAWCKRNEV